VAPQAATTKILEAGVAHWVRFVCNRWQEKLFCVLGQSHTSQVKILFQEFAVIIVVKGKMMLSLLKVCECCVEKFCFGDS